jgi:hypothetical protein
MSKLLQAVEMTPEIVTELKQHQNQPSPDRTPIREESDVLLPSLGERAFHGLAGEFVKALSPHTEADPAALLVQTLVSFGVAVGRSPHLILDGSRHQPNEYAVIVGASGKGRKGTSWARIKSVFEGADPEFATHRIKTGLSSGEGLIFQVRDPIETYDIKKGEIVISDPGVEDKRLLAMEPEFASVLKVLERDGNLLSPILRSAWDGGKLSPLTKSHPIEATDSHVSLIGHITEEELVRRLTETEAANGFGNRILWVFSRRARLLPFGGQFGPENIKEFGSRFRTQLEAARIIGPMGMTENFKQLWERIYPDLSEGKGGLSGGLTSRAEAHAMRLGMIYALIDGSPNMEADHLRAALEIVAYVQDTVRWIFGESLGDPISDAILEGLKSGPKTRTELARIFGNHKSAHLINRGLKALAGAGRIISTTEKTAGRERMVWHLGAEKAK